jgi:hypothetical protein
MTVAFRSVFGRTALLCLSFFILVGASANDDKAALARQLVEVIQYKRMAADVNQQCGVLEGTARDPVRIFESNPNVFGGVSPKSAYWPEIVASHKRYMTKLCTAQSTENMASFYARAFERGMSLEDLKALVAFYSSPAGKRFSSTNMDAMGGYMKFLEKTMAEVSASAMKEAQADMDAIVTKYRKNPR